MRIRKAGDKHVVCTFVGMKQKKRESRKLGQTNDERWWHPKLIQVGNSLVNYFIELCSRWNLLPFTVQGKNLPMRAQLYHFILLLAFGAVTVCKLAVLTNHLRCNEILNLQTSLAIITTLVLTSALAFVVAAEVKKDDGITLCMLCNLIQTPLASSSEMETTTRIPDFQAATLAVAQTVLVALIITVLAPVTLYVPHIPSSMLDVMEKMGAVPDTRFVPHVLLRALVLPLEAALIVPMTVYSGCLFMICSLWAQHTRVLVQDMR